MSETEGEERGVYFKASNILKHLAHSSQMATSKSEGKYGTQPDHLDLGISEICELKADDHFSLHSQFSSSKLLLQHKHINMN